MADLGVNQPIMRWRAGSDKEMLRRRQPLSLKPPGHFKGHQSPQAVSVESEGQIQIVAQSPEIILDHGLDRLHGRLSKALTPAARQGCPDLSVRLQPLAPSRKHRRRSPGIGEAEQTPLPRQGLW